MLNMNDVLTALIKLLPFNFAAHRTYFAQSTLNSQYF
jgi:hypothetical protein